MELRIDQIKIGERKRQDMGNLSLLSASIEQVGLLQPIGVTPDYRLVFGHRRLLACQQLGYETIEASVIDIQALTVAEHAENEIRKDFTPSERVAIGLAVEAELGKRQGQRTDLAGGGLVENFPQVASRQKTREIAAQKAGFGNDKTFRDAKTVVESGTPELVAAMDSGDLSVSSAAQLTKAPVEQQRLAAELAQRASLQKRQDMKASVKIERQGVSAIKKETRLAALRARYVAEQKYPPVLVQQDAVEFLSAIPERSVDLLLTDPPYMTDVADIEVFVDAWLPLALTRIADHGRAYIFTGSYPAELMAYLRRLLDQDRLQFHDVLVWGYQNTIGPAPTHSYKRNWQACFYLFGPNAPPLACPALTEQFAARMVNAPDARNGVRLHSWQKPDDLAQQLILHSTKPGETLLDPFAGTGTFVAAAAMLGRKAIACDINPDMLALCQQRGLSLTTTDVSVEEVNHVVA